MYTEFQSGNPKGRGDHFGDVGVGGAMLDGSLFTTAWRVLRLRMEGSPPGTEGSCEYIADSRQGVVIQFGGWAWSRQTLTVKIFCYEMFKSASDLD
jgi:hypothetical protein